MNCREQSPLAGDSPEIEFTVDVYPNPSSGDFTFDIMSNISNDKVVIRIYDIIGKELFSEETNGLTYILPGDYLVPGMYSAVVIVGDKSKVVKLVKVD